MNINTLNGPSGAGSYAQNINDILILQIQFFVDAGFNGIVDHVSLKNDDKIGAQVLKHHRVAFCGVTAALEILDQREKSRGDWIIGGPRAPKKTTHDGYAYDIFLDTSSRSSLEAAREICTFLQT